ncbi:hypothetical protein H9N25_06930 [Pedobacter riviphilus]|uniref:HTH cro/C1-type domain-containing protein n=1 Tax=Pedobacter riviphilus TaxID=2766984 RepID=A0ABX6TML0_9SPHI|nr:hypothetical protein [Pedobacter riviphilus]QNR86141.1 hypothetical protein H9N25_06930 [Pedobacter riviphilus]
MKENDFVSIWLEETGNPAIEKLEQLNLEVANKTIKVLAEKNSTENDLAYILDINPDEIKRWFMGRHIFSIKTINEINAALVEIPAKNTKQQAEFQ